MSTLFIGPGESIDPIVHLICKERVQDGDLFFCPDANSIEKDFLSEEAKWKGQNLYFEDFLIALRKSILGVVEKKEAYGFNSAHVDLGNDISCLYAAYYLICLGIEVSVTIHQEKLGGSSYWSDNHPLIKRRLSMIVLRSSKNVIVKSVETAKWIRASFPRISDIDLLIPRAIKSENVLPSPSPLPL